jgi:hypothetical protein
VSSVLTPHSPIPKPDSYDCIKDWKVAREIRPVACPIPDCEIARRARAYQRRQRLRRIKGASDNQDIASDESLFQKRPLHEFDNVGQDQNLHISLLSIGLAEKEAEEDSLDDTVVSDDSGFTSEIEANISLRPCVNQAQEPTSAAPAFGISGSPPASWLPGQQKKKLVDSGLGITCHFSRPPGCDRASWLPEGQKYGGVVFGSPKPHLHGPHTKLLNNASNSVDIAGHEYPNSAWVHWPQQKHEALKMERVYPAVSYALPDDYEDVFSASYYLSRRIGAAPWSFLYE